MKIVVAAMEKKLQVILVIVRILFSLIQKKIRLLQKTAFQIRDIVRDSFRTSWLIMVRKLLFPEEWAAEL